MGRQALLSAALWLTLSGTLAANSFVYKDNASADSAAQLYRHMPGAVYASGAPYGAYSIQIPTFISAQKTAASRIIPVKEIFQNGYLKDSYGNRFVEALQSMKSIPFKPFSQQYVQLQELPAHFAQPLPAAPANYQYKSPSQHVVVGSHYRLPVVQSSAPVPTNQYSYAQTNPGVYTGSLKNLAPAPYYNSFNSQLGPVIQLPAHTAATPQDSHKSNSAVQSFAHNVSDNPQPPTAHQQSTSYNAVFTKNQPEEQFHHISGEHKFQRLQEAPEESSSEEEPPAPVRPVHKEDMKLKTAAIQETPIPTVVNGKKTVVNVDTKPPIPLLDISLLEPLTFANPLVPQIQHFLPRIAEATYHRVPGLNQNDGKKYQKEYEVQKTNSYDSGIIKGKPKKVVPKKKHKLPDVEHVYYDNYIPQATVRPTVAVQKPDEAPEISYEINTPNHKETYKEKSVNYNKETQSEPVHYTYGTNTHNAPVHYSYTHSSKEPITIQEVRYQGIGEGPKHLIYKLKPDQQNKIIENSKPNGEEDSGESPNHSEAPHRSHNPDHTENHSNGASKPSHHHQAEHREQEYHHKPNYKHEKYHHNPSSDSYNVQQHEAHSGKHGQPGQFHSFEVIPAEYEEEIGFTAAIKVDPNQHVQHHSPHQHSPAKPQQQLHHSPAPQHHSKTNSHPKHDTPATHVQEKTKQVYIREETPEDEDSHEDNPTTSMFGKDEDNEQDFEKAYKNAAFGFPAYSKSDSDVEKDIYNSGAYGVPRDHSNYDIDHAPFQQYQEQGDNYPKEMRLSYKDDRDKTKEDYFLDYSVSKPESLVDRYKNKVDYYKLYKNQKPEKYVSHDDKNRQKQSEKLRAIPYSYFPIPEDQMKQFFAQYNAAPLMFEYDYSKGMPKDNSAHASNPFQRLKMKTHFVEPQFQYGFEPISLPRLFDSELAAVATNNSPESEKPGTRKKIYKENFYIKKTSMSALPNS